VNALGSVAWKHQDIAGALENYQQGLRRFIEIDDLFGIAYSYVTIGQLYYSQGIYPEAEKFFKESLLICRRKRDMVHGAWLLLFLGYTAYLQGQYDSTKAMMLIEALMLYCDQDKKPDQGTCLIGLAGMALGNGHVERAAILLGASEAIFEHDPNPESPLTPVQHATLVSTIQGQLGESMYTTFWTKGRAMTREQAIQYVLT
jgi:tetratricopeptide (TPR) repeat protein